VRNPVLPDQSEKPGRSGRRLLFILLSLILLGVIGLGSLRVFQLSGQDGANAQAPGESSAVVFDDLSSDTDSDTAKTAIPPLASTEREDTDTDSPAPESSESESTENSADEQTGLAISGAVLDDRGILLPDISVTARPTRRSGKDQNATQIGGGELRQQTDRLGSFTFDDLAEGEYELAVAENEQYHPAKLRVRAGVANAELMLQRIRSVRVYGIVTDDVGNPLEGVQIRALGSNLKVYSNVSGGYEIQTGPSKAGQVPIVDFSMKEYQDSRQRVEGALDSDDAEIELNVELEWESKASKVTVSGQIIGPTGEPVDGAGVWLSSPEFHAYEKTRSNALGEYQFKSVKVGNAYTLGVEPRDEYTAFKSDLLSIGPGDLNFDVSLDAAEFSDLSGTVTDLDGTPLSGFSLWARSMDMGRHPLIPVHTDGAGQFRLERIPSGAIKLESRSQPWLKATGIVLKPGESRQVEVPLDWGQNWLLGQVVDDQGNPVSRAQVVLRWSRNYLDVSSESRREVMTDQGGFFALSNLDAQDYILTVQATGYLSSRVQYRRGQSEEEVRVTLQRNSSMNENGNGAGN
jgi:protocatechuate 3,4-dioxygenase beta subunit